VSGVGCRVSGVEKWTDSPRLALHRTNLFSDT
jgi:hypothetical protein